MKAEGDQHKTHRACFNLAITLMHELAHAVWIFTRSKEYQNVLPNCREPRFTIDAPSYSGKWELGFQWEQYVLGAITYPTISAPIGLNRLLWLPNALVVCDDMLVSMDWVDQWLQKKTWDAIARTGRKGVPKPKFCVAVSVVKKAWTEEEVWELLVQDLPTSSVESEDDAGSGGVCGSGPTRGGGRPPGGHGRGRGRVRIGRGLSREL